MRTLTVFVLAAMAMPALAQLPPRACQVELSGLDFGIYSSLTPSPDTTIGGLTVRCVPRLGGTSLPRVTISTGNSGQHLDRVMLSGAAELHYNLYAEPSHRVVLGDGSAGSVALPAPRGRATGQARWPIFGAISARQSVPAGVYTDTILIQVEF